MDEVSIISLADSDISVHTIIGDNEITPVQHDRITLDQQLNACSLFVNHWVNGSIKEVNELRSAKKDYVAGLKEKPTANSTLIFDKRQHNMDEVEKITICSEDSRSPLSTKKIDESRKRKSSNCSIKSGKKKRDKKYNSVDGITESRKSFYQPKTSTPLIRKIKLIDDPRIKAYTSKQNVAASASPAGRTSSRDGILKKVLLLKKNQPVSPKSSSGTAKFEGHGLATTSSNHTVTGATDRDENKLKSEPEDHSLKPGTLSLKDRDVRNPHSSHRHGSSSHRNVASSQRRSSSSERSNRENIIKKRHSSKTLHSSSTPKLQKVNVFEEVDNNGATSEFAGREHILKKYKIPKNTGYSKQPNATLTKSAKQHPTDPSTSLSMPKSTTCLKAEKRSSNERRESSTTSETHHRKNIQNQKKNSVEATTSRKKIHESEQHKNFDRRNESPDVPELDHNILTKMNPKVRSLKFNPLKRKGIATNAIVTNGTAADGVATEDSVPNERVLKSHDITKTNKNIRVQIDSSQQTELLTSNFGGQKNDDETMELLKKHEQSIEMLQESIKKYEESLLIQTEEIVSCRKKISEQQNFIIERQQVIDDRDVKARESNQKIVDYENKIIILKDKIFVTTSEKDTILKSNHALTDLLNENTKHCRENHKDKPKPRKPKTTQKSSSSNNEMAPHPNLHSPNGSNIQLKPVEQTSARAANGSHSIAENSPLSFQTSTGSFQRLYSSSLTEQSTSALSSISCTASTPISNGSFANNARVHQKIHVQGPNFQFTVDAVNDSETPNYSQKLRLQAAVISAAQGMNPPQSSTSTTTHSNGSQPVRTMSACGRPNRLSTSNPQHSNVGAEQSSQMGLHLRSQLLNNSNSCFPPTMSQSQYNLAYAQNHLRQMQQTEAACE